MKAIMIVDLDDSFMILDEDTITLEKGTIEYRNINRLPFKIIIEGLKLKPMPQELPTPYMMRQIQIAEGIQTEKPPYTEDYQKGWNDCLEEILGEEE